MPRNWFGGIIGLLLLGLHGLLGRILCFVGLHQERQFGREDGYDMGWRSGICSRCGRTVR
jgi:hypothetical protein